jgi:hypothetical protein
MSPIELRYLASRQWMESEILAGRVIQHRVQTLVVDLSELDQPLVERIEAIRDAVMITTVRKRRSVCVLDSGIDPDLRFGATKEQIAPIDAPIVEAIGTLPELPIPTEDVGEIVQAWEDWVEGYVAEGLKVIEGLNENPPAVGDDGFLDVAWEGVTISFGDGLAAEITPEDGALAVRDARAGRLWNWAAAKRFSSESVAAAREAVAVPPSESRFWLAELEPKDLATRFVERSRKRYSAAKAHHSARSAKVPDFETEMRRWAAECGSDRLRLGLEDGYRMNARYLAERIAAEAPGMYAMSVSSAKEDWATKAASPTAPALKLRRRIAAAMARNAPPNLDGTPETEIVVVKKPPHEIYRADPGFETESGVIGTDLPSRDGWPWVVDPYDDPVARDPRPFEAVVVKHWLGRFHLIGAVADEQRGGPPGIWAVPDMDDYLEDGTVLAKDPDEFSPPRAKRKPPEPAGKESDIPF